MGIVYNKKSENEKRRRLRNSAPKAEVLLWRHLKGSKCDGLKFRRQYSIGPYVIDFYCKSHKLAVEIDGPSHFKDGVPEYDRQRQEFIESFGVRFLRFINTDIYKNIEGVLQTISDAANQFGPPHYLSN